MDAEEKIARNHLLHGLERLAHQQHMVVEHMDAGVVRIGLAIHEGTSKNYFFFDASFDTNIYYGFLKT